jgi:hypothetical protein
LPASPNRPVNAGPANIRVFRVVGSSANNTLMNRVRAAGSGNSGSDPHRRLLGLFEIEAY